ncbi:hypothetical protein [Bauldia sp.]|uniref:hypothetical protein n=1 Tax=Bauldia sp. TaxID=2575872 RepID=UPI003BADAA06
MRIAENYRTARFGFALALGLGGIVASPVLAEPYPTTVFPEGASHASVSSGPLTASIDLVRRPDLDPDFDTPVLTVSVDGYPVLEVAGVASGFAFPATEAMIADLNTANAMPEVVFTSYSGGAHCCTLVIVAEQVGDRWIAVPIGDFDGDGRYLSDLDGDGSAEIATYDNRFLYEFDCYACSAAPLRVIAVREGEARDVSAEPRYRAAHRDWLRQLEASADPDGGWTSPGYLAGWVAAKIRVGEGTEALAALEANWDFASDSGEEVCITGEDIEDCPRRYLKVLPFPERLRLFLERTGYLA